MAQGYRVTLEKDGNTLTLSPDEVSTPELPFRHSRVERWSLEVPWRDELRNYRLATVRIDYVDDTQGIDELIYYGRIDLGDAPIKQPSIRLEGRGPGYRLQDEGSLTLVFEDFTPGFEAVEQFWGQTPWTATVTTPTTSIVQTDEVAQSATTPNEFEAVFSEWLDDPAHPEYVSSDGLERHQTCHVIEGEDTGGSATFSDVNYSGGEASGIEGSGSSDLEFSFTLNYNVPVEEAAFYFRNEQGSGSGVPASVNIYFDGQKVLNDFIVTTESLSWDELLFDTDFGLQPSGTIFSGSHTIRIEYSSAFDNVAQIFDLLAFVDLRYNHSVNGNDNDFDNSVDEDNGYLDDPRLVGVADFLLYPTATQTEASFNIESSTLNVAMTSDDGNAELLQMKLEDSLWNGFSDTSSATVDWDALGFLGTGLKGRVDFGAYSPSGARNQTPRFGYASEVITEWELLRTTNDLSVIPAGTRYTGSWYNIAQEIHDDAGMIFVPQIETDGSDNIVREVESFEKGAITKTADWDRTGGSRGWNTREYANVIEVYGPVPEDDPDTSQDESLNDRPRTQVKLESEITRVGQEIHADDPIVNDQLDTEAKRNSAGRNKLLSLAAADDEDATLQIVPQIIAPGYAYDVPLLGGEATLERLQFADGTGTDAPTATLSFAQPTELPDLAARLRTRND